MRIRRKAFAVLLALVVATIPLAGAQSDPPPGLEEPPQPGPVIPGPIPPPDKVFINPFERGYGVDWADVAAKSAGMTHDRWAHEVQPYTGISADTWAAGIATFGYPGRRPDTDIYQVVGHELGITVIGNARAEKRVLALARNPVTPTGKLGINVRFEAANAALAESTPLHGAQGCNVAGVACTKNWQAGKLGLTGLGNCSMGYPVYDVYNGNVRWWATSAGHCAFEAPPILVSAAFSGFRYEGAAGEGSTNQAAGWDPYTFGFRRDVAVWPIKVAGPAACGWNPPHGAGGIDGGSGACATAGSARGVWDYCGASFDCGDGAGTWGDTSGSYNSTSGGAPRGSYQVLGAPSLPVYLQRTCHSGVTAGTSCGYYQGIVFGGIEDTMGLVMWLDGCGTDPGDSGGPVFSLQGGTRRPAGWVSRGSPDRLPTTSPLCDGLSTNNLLSSGRHFYFVLYTEIAGWGGKTILTW